jgi:hypothetical protein
VVQLLATDRVEWLIVDRRIYTQQSLTGFIYNSQEPGAFAHPGPVSSAAEHALASQPWAKLAYINDQIEIFRIQVSG